MIQNRPSALAPAPGASEPGLAASAPSEPCGLRARAGRDLPRQDLADPAAARLSASRRGLTPTVHACNTRAARRGPQLGLRLGLGTPCAPRASPLALTPSGWVLGRHPARPEPQTHSSPPPPALPPCAGAGVGDWGRRKETCRSSSLLNHFGSGRTPQGSSSAKFQICAAVWCQASSGFLVGAPSL